MTLPDDRARKRLLTSRGLHMLPTPDDVLGGVLVSGHVTVMQGTSSIPSSPVAIDMAAHVARGEEWLGKEVGVQGPVLFVVTYGAAWLKDWVKAWESENSADMTDVHFLDHGAIGDTGTEDWGESIRDYVKEVKPVLIVIDRVPQQADLGRIAAALGIRRKNRALLVLPEGVSTGNRHKNSRSLSNDADVVIRIAKRAEEFHLVCTTHPLAKQFSVTKLKSSTAVAREVKGATSPAGMWDGDDRRENRSGDKGPGRQTGKRSEMVLADLLRHGPSPRSVIQERLGIKHPTQMTRCLEKLLEENKVIEVSSGSFALANGNGATTEVDLDTRRTAKPNGGLRRKKRGKQSKSR